MHTKLNTTIMSQRTFKVTHISTCCCGRRLLGEEIINTVTVEDCAKSYLTEFFPCGFLFCTCKTSCMISETWCIGNMFCIWKIHTFVNCVLYFFVFVQTTLGLSVNRKVFVTFLPLLAQHTVEWLKELDVFLTLDTEDLQFSSVLKDLWYSFLGIHIADAFKHLQMLIVFPDLILHLKIAVHLEIWIYIYKVKWQCVVILRKNIVTEKSNIHNNVVY